MTATAAQPKKILIVDDHALVRIALKTLLAQHPQLVVVAEATCGLEALQLAKQHSPDIILLDIELPDLSGVEIAKRLLHLHAFRIIALTSHTDSFYIGQLLRLGIDGYLSKNCQPDELLTALLHAPQKMPVLDQQMIEDMAQQWLKETPPTSPFESLTQRELEILLMLCHGEKMATIAKRLFLSPKTIQMHRQKLLKKMHVNTTLELVQLAFQHNLVDKT